MKKEIKWLPPYKPVVHATEAERREKFKGCVSRQTLRAVLRKEAYKEISDQFPGELHATRRAMAFSRMHRDYRREMGLPDDYKTRT